MYPYTWRHVHALNQTPQRRAARARKRVSGYAILAPTQVCGIGRPSIVSHSSLDFVCYNLDYLLLVAELETAILDFDIKIPHWRALHIPTLHPGLHLWQVLELRPQPRPMEPVDLHPTPAKHMNSFQSSVESK